ncbi:MULTISPECIES: carbamoyltransferase N-terminal domain-containing protein [unclassified Bradyrhizobium]|uniref:carbamoyltransferase N-terminal domain-containing protein n=1 Tax=unclassified Bradyrhizobium TaxID=2631580 RepID=UPI0028E3A72E|nr:MULTISPECIES: carbamoyltransferase N-terminal domain-containing protein [unclassified Bradyrhizobium]
MKICGIKVTHDAGVALIDDGVLIFSVELEKVRNRERYSRLDDLSQVFDILRQFDVDPRSVDKYVIDGWHRPDRVKPFFGVEVRLPTGPYRRGYLSDDLLHEYNYLTVDFPYVSYSHYAGHVMGGYCSSPFAKAGEDCTVLVWDGAMLPFLYQVSGRDGSVINLGCPFYLLGDAYYSIVQRFKPFDAPIDFPARLGLAGKIMAYTAYGKVDEEIISILDNLYKVITEKAISSREHHGDIDLTENFGLEIMSQFNDAIYSSEFNSHPDFIASWHAFLQKLLISSLSYHLQRQNIKANNFCFVGGCALNIKWNSALRKSGLFHSMWIPPFPNDAGGAIGTACCAMVKHDRRVALDWCTYSGPIVMESASPTNWSTSSCDVRDLARLLHETGDPCVILHGRAELGPRALGNRSIVAPCTSTEMRSRLNDIKQREWYRPIAPVCLQHRAQEIFDPGTPDEFMLYDHVVRPEWASRIPAVTHFDGTARVQTVSAESNPFLFELLTEYEMASGIPVLCNTSANYNGRGFFPDVASAAGWGKVSQIWSAGKLYTCLDTKGSTSGEDKEGSEKIMVKAMSD